jgi:hypothetical protein
MGKFEAQFLATKILKEKIEKNNPKNVRKT